MFAQGFGSFVIEGDHLNCTVDGLELEATVYRHDSGDTPEDRDEGFWPSHDEKAAGYVLPENFATEHAKAERVKTAWENDEWWYCGVAVTVSKAGVRLTGDYDHALWGIEANYPDADNSYLVEVANDLIEEAIEAAQKKLAELCSSGELITACRIAYKLLNGLLTDNQLDFRQPDGLTTRERMAAIRKAIGPDAIGVDPGMEKRFA